MLKKTFKGTSILVLICLLAVMLAGCGPAEKEAGDEPNGGEQEVKYITVGGGAAAWAVMAAKIADVITNDIPGVEATSIPGGGIENLKKIQSGEVEFGMTHSPIAGWALDGEPPFEGQAVTKARHVMTLYKGVFQAITPVNSGLEDWADLKTKPFRINVNKEGTWGNYGTIKVLEAYGISLKDITDAGGVINQLGYDDAKTMVQDGLLDLWITPDGIIPHATVMELCQNPGVRFLGISKEIQAKMGKEVPGVEESVVPKGSYPTQDEDIPSIEIWIQLVAGEDVPDETVYQVTKALGDRIEELQTLFAGAEAISLETALTARAVPVHPGAQKYYNEKGIKE